MKLKTEIPFVSNENDLINYNSEVLLFGSCFSENIGEKLEYFKFKSRQNPFGILFHPQAIYNLIESAIQHKIYKESDVFFHNEQWHCFDAHSKLSHSSKTDLINQLNTRVTATENYIKNATHIVITLGTAWVYNFIETDKVVANCHKVPQKKFKKVLLSVDEISNTLRNILTQIRSVNYNATVIFTVSPVRHLKDGFIENSQSKAHLLAAIHAVVSNKSYYFPSYEIMMDELRDYRFYAEDMIHPNTTAINYIWEQFQKVWLSPDASKIMNNVDVVQKGMQHKPFNPSSEAHLKFLKQLEIKKEQLQNQFAHMVF
ncbi:GSCFA domain-containing protein [Algibacter sp. L3A6]|uniref:GSCFA domain-containing protein n=1 Tax=Algibacter sp. L3A6 TaxID=2686366 RepID=UPI00131CC04B|nr:GSCFA domain-containing protein [Algibacter sp. L3A6]